MREISIRTGRPVPAVAVRFRAPQSGLGSAIGEALGAAWTAVEAAGGRVEGPAFARYLGGDASEWEVDAGFPVDAVPPAFFLFAALLALGSITYLFARETRAVALEEV